MYQASKIAAFILGVACIPLGATTMPTIIVTNKSDAMVNITPIDDAHKAPAPLDQISATLPPGAFILTNQTATPINAVVVLWSYTDNKGTTQQRRFNCDGYIGGGIPSIIVSANDSALITPGGCTMREYFAPKAAGKQMLGGKLYSARNQSILDIADSLNTVRITVDSVIFADGRIWGPDSKQYYKTVAATYWAVRSVVDEIANARAAGQDMKIPLERILGEVRAGGDHSSDLRKLCASNIHDSPNPEITLKFYSQQPPLPEFQHIGEQTK
jgi:hypothetical protein